MALLSRSTRKPHTLITTRHGIPHMQKLPQATLITLPSSTYQGQSLKGKPKHNVQVCFVPKNTHKCFLSQFYSHLQWKHPFPLLFSSSFITELQQNYRRLRSLQKYQAGKYLNSIAEGTKSGIILTMLRVGLFFSGGWFGFLVLFFKIQFFKCTHSTQ